MNLDARTLLVAHTAVSLTLVPLMAAFWWEHRSTPGLGLWTLGAALIGLGDLAAALRGFIPGFVSIVCANVAGLVGLAAVWNGIRVFDGRPARWTIVLLAAGGVAAFFVYRTDVANDVLGRIVVISAVLSTGCLLCAYELLRGPARMPPTSAMLAAALFVTVSSTLAFRAVSTVIWPPEPNALAPTAVQSVHFLVSLVIKILIVGTLLMMAAQRLRQEVEARSADLDAARARAEEGSRAKSEFLAMMSHELRTPLNAIIGFSDLLRQEMFGQMGHPHYREYAADIYFSGMHLLDLITTILDISKAEAGKLKVEPVDLDARAALDTTVSLIRGVAEEKRIALAIEVPEGPLICRADPQALKQILLNLLSNAVKFTPAGGTVTAQLRALSHASVELVVRDSGVGIPAADIPRLMKPFEQIARSYSQQNGGTGLGLPLVDALIRLHGGTLHIESAVGVGTTVSVRLPSPEKLLVAAA